MDGLLKRLKPALPHVRFVSDDEFRWSHATSTVHYSHGDEPASLYGLLHESGHALLGHRTYAHDFDLLRMEADAWREAVALGARHGIALPDSHVQDCLDTYRNWIYRRSICPSCEAVALQDDSGRCYGCFNCGARWRVSRSRFCRAYRASALPAR